MMSQYRNDAQHALSLYELNTLVASVVSIDLPDEYWVEAELSEIREVRGHCYMELVEKDQAGNTPVARASAKCWASRWSMLRPMFERVTGQVMHPGMKVMLRVRAQFHAAYGFSWIVSDINPEFTMGDMMRRRMEIINRLKAEGVFELQKELRLSPFAQNIAVVSSDGAAGYGDFCRQLSDNVHGYVFSTELFAATMQGEAVEQSVIAALDRIYMRHDAFDCVVIIRGGGATSDLSGFDTLALAENVANFPLPVITGIGHDRDESVLDMVANTRVKTPTAAAQLLVDNLSQTDARISELSQSIAGVTQRRMQTERLRLKALSERIPVLFSLVSMKERSRIERLSSVVAAALQRRLSVCRQQLERVEANISGMAPRIVTDERHRIEMLAQRIEAENPQRLLRRGYSITMYKGQSVRDASTLPDGAVVETRVANGTFVSVVETGRTKNRQ